METAVISTMSLGAFFFGRTLCSMPKYPDSSFKLHGWIITRTVSAAQENWHIQNYFKKATLQSQHNDIEIVLYFVQRYFCRGKYLSGNVSM